MIKVLLFDFARVILFPRDELYKGELNKLHKDLSQTKDYKFLDQFALDPAMLDYLRLLKPRVDLYMFTSGSIQNAQEIRPTLDTIFTKIYSATELGLPKSYPLAYKQISRDIGVYEDEIAFIDDTLVNVEAAEEAGANGILFDNLENLKTRLEPLLTHH